jgi:hypothetical protein
MKIRNVSGEDRYIPSLYREVKADTVFDVPDEQAPGLLSQPNLWVESAPAPAAVAAPDKKAKA